VTLGGREDVEERGKRDCEKDRTGRYMVGRGREKERRTNPVGESHRGRKNLGADAKQGLDKLIGRTSWHE